jgi:predicted PurR-regulated permease PerM
MFNFFKRGADEPASTATPAEDAAEQRPRPHASGRLQLPSDAAFARWLAMVCAVLIAWRLRQVELLLFGSVLFGVFFNALARPLERRLRLRAGWALTAAVLAFTIALIGVLAFFGFRLKDQAVELARTLPAAWSRFRSDAGATPVGALIVHAADEIVRQAGPRLRGYALPTGQALLGFLLMAVAGIYLAAQPGPYVRGVLRLIPARQRRKARRFLEVTAELLRKWLLAEAAAMLTVGVLTFLALWAIGVPSPGALGVLAAIGEFVPMVGVLIASAPALLLAAMHGWPTVAWTLVLLTAIHQVDGNIIQPFLQRGFNAVPPVVTLFALVGFGSFLGLLGLIFAIPLTLVCMSAAQVWLGEDHELGDAGGCAAKV